MMIVDIVAYFFGTPYIVLGVFQDDYKLLIACFPVNWLVGWFVRGDLTALSAQIGLG